MGPFYAPALLKTDSLTVPAQLPSSEKGRQSHT